MMTNDDSEGRIFLSYPRTNNGFFFFFFADQPFFIIYLFIYLFQNKLPAIPDYAKMQYHMMTSLNVLGKKAWVR